MLKHSDLKRLGEGRICFVSQSQSVVNGSNGKTQVRKQELKERLWRNAGYWVAFASAHTAFLNNPELPAQGWHYPQWAEPSSLKKMPRRHAYRPTWWKWFLGWGSFFPGLQSGWPPKEPPQAQLFSTWHLHTSFEATSFLSCFLHNITIII